MLGFCQEKERSQEDEVVCNDYNDGLKFRQIHQKYLIPQSCKYTSILRSQAYDPSIWVQIPFLLLVIMGLQTSYLSENADNIGS